MRAGQSAASGHDVCRKRLRRRLVGGFSRGEIFVGGDGAPYARSAWASFSCVEARLAGLVRLRRFGFFDGFLDEGVVAVRQVVPSFVTIE